jgi:predicted HTH domain antitoxin
MAKMKIKEVLDPLYSYMSQSKKEVGLWILKQIVKKLSEITNTNSFELLDELKTELIDNKIETAIFGKSKEYDKYDMSNFPTSLMDREHQLEYLNNGSKRGMSNIKNKANREFYNLFFTKYKKVLDKQ